MTEEQALEIFRELDPLDAELRRAHFLGASDPHEFDVIIEANPLTGDQIIDIIRKSSGKGMEVTVDSFGDRAVLVVDVSEPPPIPAVRPK